jgi:hypothetical protein
LEEQPKIGLAAPEYFSAGIWWLTLWRGVLAMRRSGRSLESAGRRGQMREHIGVTVFAKVFGRVR